MVHQDLFTRRALKVLTLAEHEAQRLQHPYVGTEHILLGLLLEGNGIAANMLKERGIQYQDIQQAINQLLQLSQRRHRGKYLFTMMALSGIAIPVYFFVRRLNH